MLIGGDAMAILSPSQTDALLVEAHAVQASPRLSMGLILWKDERGRPVASARCAAILRCGASGVVWSAEDVALQEIGAPTVPIPQGLPARQPALPEAAARGLAQLAVANSEAQFIVPLSWEEDLLFLAIYDFERGPALAERHPTEELPRRSIAQPKPVVFSPPPLPPPPSQPAGRVVRVRADMGPQRQLLTIILELGDGWQDTGLDPVQLATRPLLVGFDVRMLWEVDGKPAQEPVPHLAFRHVEDGSAHERPGFRYAPSPADPPVSHSGETLVLSDRPRMRFPDTPGRIELRVIQVDCDRPVLGYRGYVRIMAMVQRAGPEDVPYKHQLDHIGMAPYEPGFEPPTRLPDPAEAPQVVFEPEI
jgi:hypothetical protein